MSRVATLFVLTAIVSALLPATSSAAKPRPCTIKGTPRADVLRGTAKSDVICGAGGNDTLLGMAGKDILRGGSGNDTMDGGDGSDQVLGEAGNDSLRISMLDTADGGIGNDTIKFVGGTLNAVAKGGAGNDTITGTNAIETIQGGPGNDKITPGLGADKVDGGPGNDTITGPAAGKRGGATGRTGRRIAPTPTWNGGAGNDTITGSTQPEVINGGTGNDTIDGGPGANDVVNGDAGDDKVDGGAGGLDHVNGGDGNDTLTATMGSKGSFFDGGTGADTITGTAAGDTITGGGGNDTVSGGDGNDIVGGGTGADVLNGGGGTDDASYQDRSEPVVLSLDGAANDGAAGEGDSITGDIESVTGGTGSDTLIGGDVNDDLNGGAGNDTLRGLGGNDDLDGGPGNDTLDGGAGLNPCRTGDGDDVIVGACEDVTPPRLRSLTVTPEVSTISSSQLLIVEARVTDDLAGFTTMSLWFRAPSSSQNAQSYVTQRISGTVLDGVYRGTITLPQYAQLGTWTLSNVNLSDRAGNQINGTEHVPCCQTSFDPATTPGLPTPTQTMVMTPQFHLASAGFTVTFNNVMNASYPVDSFEPNETSGAAYALPLPDSGKATQLSGTIHAAGDVDWFSLSLTCDGTDKYTSFTTNSAILPGGQASTVVAFEGNQTSISCTVADAGVEKSVRISVSGTTADARDRYVLSVSRN